MAKKSEKKTITIYMPKDEYLKAKECAASQGLSLGAKTRSLINEFLKEKGLLPEDD